MKFLMKGKLEKVDEEELKRVWLLSFLYKHAL